jgi:hypothetical protein
MVVVPGKNGQGLTGFPTPNEIPVENGYLLFYFPDNNDWAGLLLGAAGALTYEWNFYEWGVLLPEDASEIWKQIVEDAPYNLLPGGGDYPTPYWDDDSDVRDAFPADTQPWYGYVSNPTDPADELTFVENATIWSITGFVAFATWEVGFAPAILFNTIAKRWVLAFRRGDVGEIIRVIIDAVEQPGVDTSDMAEGEVVYKSYVGDPDLDNHDVLIVQES